MFFKLVNMKKNFQLLYLQSLFDVNILGYLKELFYSYFQIYKHKTKI